MSPSPWTDLARPPLSARTLNAALTGPSGGWREVVVLPGTPSTNADVAARARAGEAEGLVVTTDDQTGGKGRLGRSWTTPPRSAIAVSVLLRPPVPGNRWAWLSLLTGLAVVDVLRGTCGLGAVLKWPNDVQVEVDGEVRKICGILAEVVPTPGADPAVVVGTGINVSQDESELAVPTATSLALAGSATTDREVVLKAYLRALERRYRAWADAGGDPRAAGVAAAYRELCSTIGRRVRIELPGGDALFGLADGVDDEGRLLVRDDEGREHVFAAGDVVHVRPGEGA